MSVARSTIPRTVWSSARQVGLVLLAGGLAAFALWEPLEVYERSYVAETTRQAIESLREDLESDMQARLYAQVRLAELWSDRVLASETQWDLSSRLFLDHHPGYLTLEWADADGRVMCAVGREGEVKRGLRIPGTEQTLGALKAERWPVPSGTAILTRRFALPDGSAALRVIVAVARRSAVVGYLVATVDVAATFDNLAADHKGLGFSVSVTDGSTEFYRMPGSAPPDTASLVQSARLRLPGVSWTVSIWPRPELLSGMRSWLPRIAMVLGGLLGGVLVLTFHFGRAAQQTSRALQRAHGELEARVKQRTFELEAVSETLRAEVEERQRAEDSYRDLSGRLLRLQDEERRRFARELHDSTAQALGALSINVDRSQHLARAGETARLAQVLGESSKIVAEVTQEIRTVSHLLHPPMLDDLGLEYAVPWYADRFGQRSGVSVTLELDPNVGRMARETELTLFRILQEALANVHRHSGSPSVAITLLRTAGLVTLVVRDRGRGFTSGALSTLMDSKAGTAPMGIGIAGMRGRVNQLKGTLEVRSDERGTTVRAVLPVSGPGEAAPEPVADRVPGGPAEVPDLPLGRLQSAAF